MSAITGIFRRNGRNVDPTEIKKMNDKLSHRGPDGSKIWCEGPIAFGHQMLHTTPESLYETLPFEDKESGLVITADARIDNRKDLATKLGIEDNEYVSDSYFILKAYEKWGEKCPDELLGDFAFTIWDGENLFCSKDHMGVKQLYYYLDDDIFVFSTEIKALFQVKEIPYELNEKKLALYLMNDGQNHERTFYKNINNLQGAHFLKLNNFISKTKRYWKLDPNLQTYMDSEEEYAEVFLEIFAEAVECRLRSAFIRGFDLSGGLDSSSIVCMAKKILNQKNKGFNDIYTFSRIFEKTPESDERYYIKKVVKTGGIKPYFINGDNLSPIKNIDNILAQQDEPFITPHLTKAIASYQKMNELGVRVSFNGNGGDQVVSFGRNYLRELAITFQLRKFFREVIEFSNNKGVSVYKILIARIIVPSLPYSLKKFFKKILGRKQNPYTDLINEKFLEDLKIEIESYNQSFDRYLNYTTSKQFHYYNIFDFTVAIFGTLDRASAPFNVDVRFPFFDKRLIEFCYSLPSEMIFKKGWNRYILRIAMEGILPKDVQWRHSKVDLIHTHKKDILLEIEELKEMIFSDNKIMSKYVDLSKIKDIFEKYQSGKGNSNILDLWFVVLLYLWFKYTDIKN
jgi:asparagine synthase (glutamine-hydrolysing)